MTRDLLLEGADSPAIQPGRHERSSPSEPESSCTRIDRRLKTRSWW